MARIGINPTYTTNDAPAPWNNYSAADIGEKIADCLDLDTGLATGVAFEVTDAPSGVLSGDIASTTPNGWPVDVWEFCHYGAIVAKFRGLTAGDSFTLYLGGHSGDAEKDTNFTVNGVTKLYEATGAEPAAPVSFIGTVPANGEVEFSNTGVQTFPYFSGAEIITLPGVAIQGTAVADNQDSPLPSPLTADYAIYSTTTGALVGSKGQVVITNGAFTIADSALVDGTQYDLHLRLPDGSRDRSVRMTAQSTAG